MKIPQTIIEKTANAKHIAVLTGAGVSAESGIKTFRDPDGLWAKLNPAELASIDGFMANPKMVWEWYQHRREIIASCRPNPGHYALSELAKIVPKLTLITQNVDRLHQQAGSEGVVELHGNIIENHCFRCRAPFAEAVDLTLSEPPLCPKCGGQIRPSVVWFGENLPEGAMEAAEEAAAQCDVFFSIGTSAEVYPAANLPIFAKRSGAFVVEVNPRRTAISSYLDATVELASGEALPLLLDGVKKLKGII